MKINKKKIKRVLCLFTALFNFSLFTPLAFGSHVPLDSFPGKQKEKPVTATSSSSFDKGSHSSSKGSSLREEIFQEQETPLSRHRFEEKRVQALLQGNEKGVIARQAQDPEPADISALNETALREFKVKEILLIRRVAKFLRNEYEDETEDPELLDVPSLPGDVGGGRLFFQSEYEETGRIPQLPQSPEPLTMEMIGGVKDDGTVSIYDVQVLEESMLVLSKYDFALADDSLYLARLEENRYNPEAKPFSRQVTTFNAAGQITSRRKDVYERDGTTLHEQMELKNTYDDEGRLTERQPSHTQYENGKVKDVFKAKDSYQFDASGHLIHQESQSQMNAAVRSTQTGDFSYDGQGRETSSELVTTHFDEDGEEERKETLSSERQYDSVTGKLASETVSAKTEGGGEISLQSVSERNLTYNTQGNLTEDRVTLTVNGSETVTSHLLTYDASGIRLLQETFAADRVVTQENKWEYDSQKGFLIKEEEIHYEGNRIDFKKLTAFKYAGKGNKTTEKILEQWDFSSRGEPASWNDTMKTFDGLGRLKGVTTKWQFAEEGETFKGDSNVAFGYNKDGTLKSYSTGGKWQSQSGSKKESGQSSETFSFDATGALKSYSQKEIKNNKVVSQVTSTYDPRFSFKPQLPAGNQDPTPDPTEEELELGLVKRTSLEYETAEIDGKSRLRRLSIQKKYTLDSKGGISKATYVTSVTLDSKPISTETEDYAIVAGLDSRLKLVSYKNLNGVKANNFTYDSYGRPREITIKGKGLNATDTYTFDTLGTLAEVRREDTASRVTEIRTLSYRIDPYDSNPPTWDSVKEFRLRATERDNKGKDEEVYDVTFTYHFDEYAITGATVRGTIALPTQGITRNFTGEVEGTTDVYKYEGPNKQPDEFLFTTWTGYEARLLFSTGKPGLRDLIWTLYWNLSQS